MSNEKDCIFCKIIAAEIPSFKLYEDADTFAFMDINPASTGHALVIPKAHHPDVYSISDDAIAAVSRTAKRIARAVEAVVEPDGMNLLQCNGPGAAQSVFHFHMHVLPRRIGDDLRLNWGPKPGDMQAIEQLARQIRAALEA